MHILIVLIVITAVIFLMARKNHLFVLSVSNGQVQLERGNVRQRIINEFSQAIKPHMKGRIMGVKRGSGVTLSFEGNMDEFTQQRLRNIYGLSER